MTVAKEEDTRLHQTAVAADPVVEVVHQRVQMAVAKEEDTRLHQKAVEADPVVDHQTVVVEVVHPMIHRWRSGSTARYTCTEGSER
jgi:hypothetical protein